MRVFPRLMLWAWERPEELSTLPVDKAGVAFLAQTVTVQEGRASIRPRLQPLHVPAGARLMAVTRIEVAPPLAASGALRDRLVEAILATARPGVLGLQVDFDARASERAFYADLLRALRARMDPAMPLSMTALASWGLFDGWIADLPVDEAVPMAFDMGPDDGAVRHWLAAKRPMREPLARRAFGLCLQEKLPWVPSAPRVYVFNREAWNATTMREALKEHGS
ncbi:MAG TPA: hypothetical protein VFM84_07415 [Holophagaceae bacterium]|nr:hypothetical protein [Holophagaceae bacterium]